MSRDVVGECVAHLQNATREALESVKVKAHRWLAGAKDAWNATRGRVQDASARARERVNEGLESTGRHIDKAYRVMDYVYGNEPRPFAGQRLLHLAEPSEHSIWATAERGSSASEHDTTDAVRPDLWQEITM